MKNIPTLVYIIFCLVLVCACEEKRSEQAPNYQKEIDGIFSDWNGQRPGGAFAVIQEGEVIYENYFGMANLDKGESFRAQTVTDIGSVSKQFTAMCIALLEGSNKLALQDDIRIYLPEFPVYSDTVRITHLIHHSSGIKDYEALVQLKNQHYFDEFMTNSYVVELAAKQQSLNFQPGCKYEYSNTNYLLLAEIVERVSGQSLNEFASEHIFIPLGMSHTFFNANQGEDFANRAMGYEPNEDGFAPPVYRSQLVGDGGVYTTLEDMIKWDQNFFNNQLGSGSAQLVERMKFIEAFCDGSKGSYAFAQTYTKLPYGNSWSHGGGGGGYRTFYERFEEDNISFIALSNADNSNAFGKVIQTAKLFLSGDSESQSQPQAPVGAPSQPSFISPDKALIDKFEGFYYDSANIRVLHIEFDKSQALFQVVTIDEWKDVFATALIHPDTLVEKEEGTGQFIMEGPNTVYTSNAYFRGTFRKLEAPTTSINTYVGRYDSEEVSHQVTLSLKEGRIHASNNYFKSLVQVAEDFFVDEDTGAILTFKRDEMGHISSFTIDIKNGDRQARGIIFSKVNGS